MLSNYLKNRFAERSTTAGLVALGVSAACLIFPEHSFLINSVAGALGISLAVVPTGGRPQ